MLKSFNYEEPGQQAIMEDVPVVSAFGNSMFDPVTGEDSQSFIGISDDDKTHLANLDSFQMGGEMSELDDAGTYFDGGVHECAEGGYFHYMCTRNNNFSNRSQKGQIRITLDAFERFTVGGREETIQIGAVSIDITPDAVPDALDIDIRAGPSRLESSVANPSSHVATVSPANVVANGQTIMLRLAFDGKTLHSPTFYHSVLPEGPFNKVDGDVNWSDGVASVSVTQGGTYYVENSLQGGYVALIVILCLLAVAGIVGGIVFYKSKQGKGSPL